MILSRCAQLTEESTLYRLVDTKVAAFTPHCLIIIALNIILSFKTSILFVANKFKLIKIAYLHAYEDGPPFLMVLHAGEPTISKLRPSYVKKTCNLLKNILV